LSVFNKENDDDDEDVKYKPFWGFSSKSLISSFLIIIL